MKPSIWHPVSRARYVKQRNGRIGELLKYIRRIEREELEGTKTRQERGEAFEVIDRIVRDEWEEIAHLQQEDTFVALHQWGVDIPDRYKEGTGHYVILSTEGTIWASRAIREARRSNLEAWGRALAPFLTSAISLLSALISLGAMLVALAALHKK